MQEDIVFAGFGGQGIMFAGQLVTYAAMDSGYHVTWIPSYGPEMRGGTAYCFVVLGDQPIGSPVVHHPHTALIFNQPSFEKFEPQLAPNGYLIYNASMITPTGHARRRTDLHLVPVPAAELADSLGNRQLTNLVMLGAALTVHPFLTLDAIRQALADHLPAHRKNLLGNNLKALELGAAAVPTPV